MVSSGEQSPAVAHPYQGLPPAVRRTQKWTLHFNAELLIWLVMCTVIVFKYSVTKIHKKRLRLAHILCNDDCAYFLIGKNETFLLEKRGKKVRAWRRIYRVPISDFFLKVSNVNRRSRTRRRPPPQVQDQKRGHRMIRGDPRHPRSSLCRRSQHPRSQNSGPIKNRWTYLCVAAFGLNKKLELMCGL